HVQDRIEAKLGDLAFQINSVGMLQHLALQEIESLIAAINASGHVQKVQEKASDTVQQGQPGWGNFLPDSSLESEQHTCAEKQELEYYSMKLLYNIEQVTKSVVAVLNQTTSMGDPSQTTLLTGAAMTRIVHD